MRCQRGVALITVLLVLAIVTVVSAAMVARQQLSIRASSNQLQARQAWHYALGGEALAQAMLARDLRAGATGETGANGEAAAVDHLLEPWAQPLPAFEIDQGEILVRIEDLAGRFNLNDLPSACSTGSIPTSSRAASWVPKTTPISASIRPIAAPVAGSTTCPSCACCWTCAKRIFSAWRPMS